MEEKLKNTIVFSYLNDIIIPFKTIEEGLTCLQRVLEVFRAHGLTLNLRKCKFLAKSIDYLERKVSEEGIRLERRKVEAVMQMNSPGLVKQVRQFVDIASYFRKYIRNFATIMMSH